MAQRKNPSVPAADGQFQCSAEKVEIEGIHADTVDGNTPNRFLRKTEDASDRSTQILLDAELTQEVKDLVEKPPPLREKSYIKRIKNFFGGAETEKGSMEKKLIIDPLMKEKLASPPQLPCYKTNHRYRGRVVLIDEFQFEYHQDLSDREGSDLDTKKLREVFRKLGFKPPHVQVLINASFECIMHTLEEVAKEDFSDHDMFVCAILTHGESGHLHAYDKLFAVERLWEPFADDKCKTLQGKPKIFIIQACRGTQLDPGVEVVSPKKKQRNEDQTDGYDQNEEDNSPELDSQKNSQFETTVIKPSGSTSSLSSLETQHTPRVKGHNRHCSESGMNFSSITSPDRHPSGDHLTVPAGDRRPSLPEVDYLSSPAGSRRSSMPTGERRPSVEVLRQQLLIRNPQVRRSSRDQVDARPADSFRLNSAHSIPDTLVAYSTVDGYYSFRRPTTGSWFIQTVCEKFLELYKTEDLMSIMTHVNSFVATEMMSYVSNMSKREFHQKKQVPCIVSTFTKLLYFIDKEK